jgi:DNA-binding NarL/FixJ family response regulator
VTSTDPTPAPRRIVIVDADRRVRQSLASILELAAGIEVVGVCAGVAEAVSVVSAQSPHVVAIDPRLPDVADGLALVSALRRREPGVRIVVMSCDALEQPALRHGADGFAAKDGSAAEFVAALLGEGQPFARLAEPPVAPAEHPTGAAASPVAT